MSGHSLNAEHRQAKGTKKKKRESRWAGGRVERMQPACKLWFGYSEERHVEGANCFGGRGEKRVRNKSILRRSGFKMEYG